MSRLFIFTITFLIVIGLMGVSYYSPSLAVDLEGSREVIFIVNKGESAKEIIFRLKEKSLINSEFTFKLYVFIKKLENKFQVGEYRLYTGIGMAEIIKTLTVGAEPLELKITIIEGWSSKKIAEYLEKNKLVKAKDFLNAIEDNDGQWSAKYAFLNDKPEKANLEGYLFPDTYRVYAETDVNQIIEKMLDNFDKQFYKKLKNEIEKQDKTVYEVLTMASLVEKEVQKDKDKEIVAGIFYKRIKAGMALESCATINYILGDSRKRLSIEDTKIESPYNTYINRGLPPGPISSPSLSTIEAVVYPKITDYWYFLSKDDGETVFSKTYEEHLTNKNKYLK